MLTFLKNSPKDPVRLGLIIVSDGVARTEEEMLLPTDVVWDTVLHTTLGTEVLIVEV